MKQWGCKITNIKIQSHCNYSEIFLKGVLKMEGRTQFNYGPPKRSFTINDLKYMLDIVDSDLSDQDKATKLYAFCSYSSLLSVYVSRKYFEPENKTLLDYLKRLLSI